MSARSTIKRRGKRRAIGNPNKIELHFTFNCTHFPAVVEQDIQDEILDIFPDFSGSIVVLDCPKECRSEEHGAHVYIHMKDATAEDTDHLIPLITQTMMKKHSLSCAAISFFDDDEFSMYVHEDKKFKLSDDIQNGKFLNKMIHQWVCQDAIVIEEEAKDKCKNCYPSEDMFTGLVLRMWKRNGLTMCHW